MMNCSLRNYRVIKCTMDKNPYWAEFNFLFNDSEDISESYTPQFEHQSSLYVKHGIICQECTH